MIYDQYGYKAKEIGLYWGGDFVGFPDPGHIQAFLNSASLIQKYPEVALEYEPFKMPGRCYNIPTKWFLKKT